MRGRGDSDNDGVAVQQNRKQKARNRDGAAVVHKMTESGRWMFRDSETRVKLSRSVARLGWAVDQCLRSQQG